MDQKVVVLTGAAGGIGQALTRRFLDDGACVVAVDLLEDRLKELQQAMNNSASLTTFKADVGSEADCLALAAEVRRLHSHVDVLVNNAGYFPTCEFADMSYAQWKEIIRINLDSVFLTASSLLPLMEPRGWGRIINIGSGSVFRGVATQVHYVSAKAGVIGFTRSLARALGNKGITVNLVAPGLTATPAAIASLGEAAMAKRRSDRSIQRDQQPQDVVGAVMFLASRDSDFMTGQTLLIDGGALMN